MSCIKECDSCPFGWTELSEMGQNSGCLPSPYDIKQMRVLYGKTWACHDDFNKPCVGALDGLREQGYPYKVEDKQLLTLDHDWWLYTK